jgi:hypothetical protein
LVGEKYGTISVFVVSWVGSATRHTFRAAFALIWVEAMKTHELKFYCPHCDQALKCGAEYAGRQIECPGCRRVIRIPNPPSGTGFTEIEPKALRDWDTHAWGG